MAAVTIHLPDSEHVVAAAPGNLLADVLSAYQPGFAMPCGGQGRCGKCRVLATGALSPLTSNETRRLSAEEIARGMRLSCNAAVLGDVHVWLAGRDTAGQICASGVEASFARQPMFTTLGAAVDIGTTTLAAQLYDHTGLLATASMLNPQMAFGADVISRIGNALKGRARELADSIRRGVGALLEDLCRQVGVSAQALDALVITGNTTMLYLLTEVDVTPLSAAPFEIQDYFGRTIPAGALELPVLPETPVYLPRCISAFVGADITTALLASGLYTRPATALLADIGTNGELALWHGGTLYCCSTAAGPAFEGATLTCGMQGTTGAVDHVHLQEGSIVCHTIGGAKAAGNCGSGVADLVAVLKAAGRMDETGYLPEEQVTLADGVIFTQDDIRQVQLAKSAIRSGIEALLKTNEIPYEAVAEFAVAGGFGSYLSVESAAAIGLIPPPLADRCKSIGNAALAGAAMLLRSLPLQAESEAMAAQAKGVDLATSPLFVEQYMEQMLF